MRFSKNISLNSQTIFKAKIYNFSRRSIWKYAIVSLLLAIVEPRLFGTMPITFFGIFAILCLISIVAMKLSTKVLERKFGFEANAEFSKEGINMVYRNSEMEDELKTWGWINKVVETKNEIWLETTERSRLTINLPKSKLSSEEVEFIRQAKKNQR